MPTVLAAEHKVFDRVLQVWREEVVFKERVHFDLQVCCEMVVGRVRAKDARRVAGGRLNYDFFFEI